MSQEKNHHMPPENMVTEAADMPAATVPERPLEDMPRGHLRTTPIEGEMPRDTTTTGEAESDWGGWESLGGYCTDGVAISSWEADRLDCFVIGHDRALWQKWWNGSSWSGWERLGAPFVGVPPSEGGLYSAPAAVARGYNLIDVFALGVDRALWHMSWSGSSWSEWESLGGYCTDGVAVSSWEANRLDCFVIGNDRALWHKWWDSSSWSEWERLDVPAAAWPAPGGRGLYSAPAAVSRERNLIDVLALGGDRGLWHKRWNGASWTGWMGPLGGTATDGVAVSSGKANRLDCFTIRFDRALWHRSSTSDGPWGGWNTLGAPSADGGFYSAPAAVSRGDRIDVVAIGGDRALWHKSRT